MTASTTDATKWAALNENIGNGIVGDPAAIEAALDDVRAVVDQHATEVNAHLAENAIDAHGTMPAARVTHTLAQSVIDSTHVPLAFNTERFDTDDIHDAVTNNTRLTCKTAGVYQISGNISFELNATGFRQVGIRLNGNLFIATLGVGASASATSLSVSTIYQLNVNDYVELCAYQTSGGAINVAKSTNYSPEFSMVKVG